MMLLRLTYEESKILSGATLMYSGVPFGRVTTRSALCGEAEVLFHRIIDARDAAGAMRPSNVEFSFPELHTLREILNAILDETRGLAGYIELHVGARENVEEMLARIEQLIRRGEPPGAV